MYYLLAIIICAIVVVACIVLAIISVVSKKLSFFITSVIVFALAVIGGVFCIFQYAIKTISYIKSDGIQATISNEAEVVGKTAGSIISGGVKGLNTTLNDDAIATLAAKSAIIIGKTIKISAAGLDATFKTPVFLDASIANCGLEFGRAEAVSENNSYDISVFISFTKAFKGNLKLLMYDNNGKKMDVAETAVNEQIGVEKIVRFSFPSHHVGIATYYILYKL